MRIARAVIVLLMLFALLLPAPSRANDASIYFSPSAGQFRVGSTIDISIVINTGSHPINAISTNISFPPDKLQVISPSVGTSFISVWTAVPSYSNTNGTLSFAGGLPSPGIKSSSAVLSTIQFRVKSAGKATLKFSDDTVILANDGVGSDVLSSKTSAILTLENAPPDGPVVTSSTHPDQNVWYSSKVASFSWEAVKDATDYSVAVNNSTKTTPNEESSTKETSITKDIDGDGIWYFHIRALANSIWGGTTNFLLRVDTTPPADFRVGLDKSIITPEQRAVINFLTTDAASGVDHYETKIINKTGNNFDVSLFHEEVSPYQLPALEKGSYDVIVRAYDSAGNYTDSSVELNVKSSGFSLINLIKSPIFIGASLFTLLLIIFIAAKRRKNRERRIPIETSSKPQSANNPPTNPTLQ